MLLFRVTNGGKNNPFYVKRRTEQYITTQSIDLFCYFKSKKKSHTKNNDSTSYLNGSKQVLALQFVILNVSQAEYVDFFTYFI